MKYEFFTDNGVQMVRITVDELNCVVRAATPEDHAAAESCIEQETKPKGVPLDEAEPYPVEQRKKKR